MGATNFHKASTVLINSIILHRSTYMYSKTSFHASPFQESLARELLWVCGGLTLPVDLQARR